jgi:hypothetical protein
METTTSQRLNLRVVLIGAGIVLLIGFLAGFVPQYRNASSLRSELHNRDGRIRTLEREANLSRARHTAGLMYLELTRRNYGIAAQHATAFFDQVRTMLSDAAPEVRDAFHRLLGQRDAVTAGIAKSDPAVVGVVQNILDDLHRLKYQ